MAGTRLTCPACNTALRLAREVPAGRKIKCPKCGASFAPSAESVRAAEPAQPVVSRRNDDDADEDRSPRQRYRPKRRQKSYVGLIVGLVALILFVAVGAVVAVVVVRAGRKSDATVASAPPTSNRNV